MDPIAKLEEQIDETKNVLLDNCEKVINREAKLDILNEKSDLLQYDSTLFRRKSRNLKHKMIIKNYTWYFIAGFIILLIVLIIIFKNK